MKRENYFGIKSFQEFVWRTRVFDNMGGIIFILLFLPLKRKKNFRENVDELRTLVLRIWPKRIKHDLHGNENGDNEGVKEKGKRNRRGREWGKQRKGREKGEGGEKKRKRKEKEIHNFHSHIFSVFSFLKLLSWTFLFFYKIDNCGRRKDFVKRIPFLF